MSKRLLITMPGERSNKELYVAALDRLGLLAHCDFVHQNNTKLYGKYPDDYARKWYRKSKWKELAEQVYYDSQDRLRRDWAPKPFTHTFYNYEQEGWMWDKEQNGYTKNDIRFVKAILRGMQEANPTLKRSMYMAPRITNGPIKRRDYDHVIQMSPATRMMDWVWFGLYPTTDYLNRPMTKDIMDTLRQRVRQGYALMEANRLPVIPSFFLHYSMSVKDVVTYHKTAIEALPSDCDQINIWTDLRDQAPNQIEHLEAVAPMLLERLEK